MKIVTLIICSLTLIYSVPFGNGENYIKDGTQTPDTQTLKKVSLAPSARLLSKINQQLESIGKGISKMDDISKNMKGIVKNLKHVLLTTKSVPVNRLSAIYKELLAINNQLQMETRSFNAISNALKVKHDSEMAVIRNLR